MEVQFQALLAAGRVGEAEVAAAVLQPNTESNVEVAKPQIFNGKVGKILGSLTICKLFIRMKIRDIVVEEQIQWVLSYVQTSLADV